MKAYLLIPMALAACSPDVVVKPIPIPADLTECAEEPAVPELPAAVDAVAQRARDVMTLEYILALRSAYGDCRGKVEGLKAYSEGLE